MTLTRRTFMRSSAALGSTLAFGAIASQATRAVARPALGNVSSQPSLAGSVERAQEALKAITEAGLPAGEAAKLPAGARFMSVKFPAGNRAGAFAETVLRFTTANGEKTDVRVQPSAHGKDGSGAPTVSDPVEVPTDVTSIEVLDAKLGGLSSTGSLDAMSRAYMHMVDEQAAAGTALQPKVGRPGADKAALKLPNVRPQDIDRGIAQSTDAINGSVDFLNRLNKPGNGGAPGVPPVIPPTGTSPKGGSCEIIGGIKCVSRAEWGCDESLRDWTTDFAPAQLITVHHSAMPAGVGDYAKVVQSIYRFHASDQNGGRGWGDVGYHLLIDPNGVIYQGRYTGSNKQAVFQPGSVPGHPASVTAGHVFNANTSNIGICLLGDFQAVRPTQAAIDSLTKVVGALCKGLGIDPRGSVHYHNRDTNSSSTRRSVTGHRDWSDVAQFTTCPGDLAYSLLDQVRQKA